MATTYSDRGTASVEATGSIAEAGGGIAVIVLAIVGLATAGAAPFPAIAVTVLGAAMLTEGAAIATEYVRVLNAASESATSTQAGYGMTTEIIIGGAVLVLGILSLVGVAAATLTTVAVITAGALMVVSAPVMVQLNELRHQHDGMSEQAHDLLRASSASVSGLQILAGLTAIVLGVIALSRGAAMGGGAVIGGGAAMNLPLISLLVLGAALTFNGTALTGSIMKLIQR